MSTSDASAAETAEQPPAEAPPGPVKTYRGNCHCGAFVFEVEAPEIAKGSDCNCSICTKRAYLWLVPEKPIVVVKDEGKLVGYRFASKNMDHQVSCVLVLPFKRGWGKGVPLTVPLNAPDVSIERRLKGVL